MPLEHAILAFIDFEPMTGYDLKKYFDQSVAHFWSATQSHIYKSLEGLEEKGWAEANLIVQESKPNRKVFKITEAGCAELRRWLITPLPLEQLRVDWLIQIFFSHQSSNEEITALLESRTKETLERLHLLRTAAQNSLDENAEQIGVERASQLWQLTLDYGIAYYKSELKWIKSAIKRIQILPPLEKPNHKNKDQSEL